MIDLERNVGMVVLRTWYRYRAPLCREHGMALAREWLIKTLVLGWWGVISFFFNFMAVAKDMQAWRLATRLPPPGSLAVTATPPVEPFTVVPPPTWGMPQLASVTVPASGAAGVQAALTAQLPNQLSSQPRPNELSATGSAGTAPQPPIPSPGPAVPAPTGGMAPPLPPAPPRATSPLRRFRGLFIIVAIVVVVAVVGVVFRDRITGNAGSLQVGDCFDLPAATATDATVGDVQHHPCTEAHGGEVYAVLTYPSAATDTYPPTDAFVAFGDPHCASSFQAYTGVTLDASTTLNAGYFFPIDTGWASGDRTVICYLVDAGGAPLTRSMKSAAP
jgi:hypothetical protein